MPSQGDTCSNIDFTVVTEKIDHCACRPEQVEFVAPKDGLTPRTSEHDPLLGSAVLANTVKSGPTGEGCLWQQDWRSDR